MQSNINENIFNRFKIVCQQLYFCFFTKCLFYFIFDFICIYFSQFNLYFSQFLQMKDKSSENEQLDYIFFHVSSNFTIILFFSII